ncbi:MAG: YbjN domain-containing protein [Pseudomonadota bacterium]
MWFRAALLSASLTGLAGCDVAPEGWAAPDQPLPTPAALIDASDPQEVTDIVARRGTGYWTRDGSRDPLIEMVTAGVAWQVEFYGCVSGRECTDLRFVSRLATSTQDGGRDAAIEEWNATHRFGKLTAGRGNELILEMNTVLAGGVSRQNLDLTLDWWLVALKSFHDEFAS